MDPQLARGFFDRFAGFVNRETPQLRTRKVPDRGHSRRVNGSGRLSNGCLSLLLPAIIEVADVDAGLRNTRRTPGCLIISLRRDLTLRFLSGWASHAIQ